MTPDVLATLDDAALCARLAAVPAIASTGEHACVGILNGGTLTFATHKADGCSTSVRDAANLRVPIGCIAKCLTGTLALRAERQGMLDFDRPIANFAPGLEPDVVCPDLTVRQLLNHTHGLDVSGVENVPRLSGSRIDLPGLSRALPAPLFAPGTMYSYSSAGSWITAALLESRYEACFNELLTKHVLDPCGIDPVEPLLDADDWCPANGGALQMSVPQILGFLRWICEQPDLREHREFSPSVPPPGWCLERGAAAGWKFYGSGWYGHNTQLPAQSMIVRVNLAHRVGIAVAAASPAAGAITVRLFGRLLPEYASVKFPRPLPAPPDPEMLQRCAGVYANRAMQLTIFYRPPHSLLAHIDRSPSSPDAGMAAVTTALTAGTQNAFLAEPHCADIFSWLQFLSDGSRGEYTHLWDGRQILRRA